MKTKTDNTFIIMLSLVILVIVVGYLVLVGKTRNVSEPVITNNYQQVQTNNDLKKASTDLDASDIGALDTQLNQLSSDSSGF